MSVRGVPIGWQTSQVTRSGDGIRVVDHLSIGAFAEQRTEILLGRDGTVHWVQQGGIVQGVPIRTSLEYRRNRVRGVTVVPTSLGGVAIPADTTIPPGTIDDNAITAFLPALPWGPDARWTFPDFVATSDTIRKVLVDSVRTMTLRVTGPATVSLPTGAVSTWQVELGGGPSPVVYFISQDRPHRLVRMELPGAGFEFVLVN
ncbi:MAG TPA: hypothetical protein VFI13_13250 [Gemmatimonadales bacterium]|nr:hypothetical protein [Gemmatimonadales bacterium]